MTEPNPIPHVLILGGTAEARQLAGLITAQLDDQVRLTTSLAGRTKAPVDVEGDVRIGGFGGVTGLIEYIKAERVNCLIDATHPFAAVISQHAHEAAEKTGLSRLMIERPRWPLPDGLDIRRVSDLAAAADNLAKSEASRVLITTGIQNLDVFSELSHIRLLVRQIENHEEPLPLDNAETVVQKPPFTVEGECTLMTENGIDTLVSKESGGTATEAKLIAAAKLGIRVIMVERPAPPPGDHVATPEEAVTWLQGCLGRST